jgi:hypothetical protein
MAFCMVLNKFSCREVESCLLRNYKVKKSNRYSLSFCNIYCIIVTNTVLKPEALCSTKKQIINILVTEPLWIWNVN